MMGTSATPHAPPRSMLTTGSPGREKNNTISLRQVRRLLRGIHVLNINAGGEGRFVNGCLLDIRIRRATCHLVVQSFFHQPLRSIKFCVLSIHVCEDAPLHVRSFLVVHLDAFWDPFCFDWPSRSERLRSARPRNQ